MSNFYFSVYVQNRYFSSKRNEKSLLGVLLLHNPTNFGTDHHRLVSEKRGETARFASFDISTIQAGTIGLALTTDSGALFLTSLFGFWAIYILLGTLALLGKDFLAQSEEEPTWIKTIFCRKGAHGKCLLFYGFLLLLIFSVAICSNTPEEDVFIPEEVYLAGLEEEWKEVSNPCDRVVIYSLAVLSEGLEEDMLAQARMVTILDDCADYLDEKLEKPTLPEEEKFYVCLRDVSRATATCIRKSQYCSAGDLDACLEMDRYCNRVRDLYKCIEYAKEAARALGLDESEIYKLLE